MPMAGKGLVKLQEELNELGVEVAKKLAYFDTDEHPDGKGSLTERIENEASDVLAAIRFVVEKWNLDFERMIARCDKKYNKFLAWDADPGNNAHSFENEP